jgi:uncharacterized membrane protein YfcA
MDTLYPLMAIVFFANIAESLAGFGAMVLALTLGARYFNLEDLVPILIPLNLVVSLAVVIRHWQEIERRTLFLKIFPLTLLGLPLGILSYQLAPGLWIQALFGLVIVALGVFELLRAFKNHLHEAPPLSLPVSIGFLISGGIMQGLYGSGGPFVVYYASRAIPDKAKFRATLSLLWLVLNLFVVVSLILTRKINVYTIQFSLYLLPFVLAGMVVGFLIHNRVSQKNFRLGVYGLLVLAGLSLLYRTVT